MKIAYFLSILENVFYYMINLSDSVAFPSVKTTVFTSYFFRCTVSFSRPIVNTVSASLLLLFRSLKI